MARRWQGICLWAAVLVSFASLCQAQSAVTPEDNRVLEPFVDMQYTLLRQQAEHGQWVTPQARQARLAQIEADHRRALRQLQSR